MSTPFEQWNTARPGSQNNANEQLNFVSLATEGSIARVDARGDGRRAQISPDDLPALFLEEVAKVDVATQMKQHTDKNGAAHTDYYLNGQKVFAEIKDHDKETRISYDAAGREEGRRVRYGDGRTVTTFGDGFDKFQIFKDGNGTIVLKQDEDGKFTPVKDAEERQEILEKAKQEFTRPTVIGGA